VTTRDHFAALGLERRFALDRELLEQRYLERAAAAHPDRVATAASEVRRAAMEESAALNAAYGVLRNPVARLEHLVALAGIDLDSSDRERGAPHPERAFLIDMIERREQLDALAGELEAREAQRMQVEDERDALFAVAQAALERGEVREAALALVHRRYLQRLLDEFETS
jgi:molecular chaperone HscB